jgi:hypothetical protein
MLCNEDPFLLRTKTLAYFHSALMMNNNFITLGPVVSVIKPFSSSMMLPKKAGLSVLGLFFQISLTFLGKVA